MNPRYLLAADFPAQTADLHRMAGVPIKPLSVVLLEKRSGSTDCTDYFNYGFDCYNRAFRYS